MSDFEWLKEACKDWPEIKIRQMLKNYDMMYEREGLIPQGGDIYCRKVLLNELKRRENETTLQLLGRKANHD